MIASQFGPERLQEVGYYYQRDYLVVETPGWPPNERYIAELVYPPGTIPQREEFHTAKLLF